MDENKLVQFTGFNPSAQTRDYLDAVFNQILYIAPYNSALRVLFSKKKSQYKITVQINSYTKRFFAMASHSHLKRATDMVDDKLRKQIERWKTTRFDSTAIRDLSILKDLFATEGVHHEHDVVA